MFDLSTLSDGLWFPATTDQAFSKHTLLSPIPPIVPHTVKGTIIHAPNCPSIPHTCGVFFPSLITVNTPPALCQSLLSGRSSSSPWVSSGRTSWGQHWLKWSELCWGPLDLKDGSAQCKTLPHTFFPHFLTSLAGAQCPLYYRMGKSQVLLVWLSVGDSSGSRDIQERGVLTAGRAPSWQEVCFYSCFLSPPVADNLAI